MRPGSDHTTGQRSFRFTVALSGEAQIRRPLAPGRMMRASVDAILRGGPDGVYGATFAEGYRVQATLGAITASAREKRLVEVAA